MAVGWFSLRLACLPGPAPSPLHSLHSKCSINVNTHKLWHSQLRRGSGGWGSGELLLTSLVNFLPADSVSLDKTLKSLNTCLLSNLNCQDHSSLSNHLQRNFENHKGKVLIIIINHEDMLLKKGAAREPPICKLAFCSVCIYFQK